MGIFEQPQKYFKEKVAKPKNAWTWAWCRPTSNGLVAVILLTSVNANTGKLRAIYYQGEKICPQLVRLKVSKSLANGDICLDGRRCRADACKVIPTWWNHSSWLVTLRLFDCDHWLKKAGLPLRSRLKILRSRDPWPRGKNKLKKKLIFLHTVN